MSLPPAERRGSQKPRVSNYPPYVLSGAPEVIDLAASGGLVLDDWQQYVLTHGLGMTAAGRWTANKVSTWVPRQNGKGAIIEALELFWLFMSDEELIVHSAHQHRTSQKAYGRLEKIIRGNPDWHRRVHQYRQANGEQQIELRDGRMLQYTTRSRTAVRGFSAPKLILDEAQELTAEQMAAILPTVSAMDNWQVWFFGTPPDQPDAWAYGLKEDGESKSARLAHFDWGVGPLDFKDPSDVARIHHPDTWYGCNPALGIRIAIETVEDEDKPSGLGEKFPQERLGYWQPRSRNGGTIDPARWSQLAAEWQPSRPVALGIDIAPQRDWAAINAYGHRDDDIGQVRLIEYRPGTDWVVPRMVELKAGLNPVGFAMGRGTYESLKQDLADVGIRPPEDPEKPRRGDLAVLTGTDMAAACGQLIDAVRQSTIRQSPSPQQDAAVAGGRTRLVGDVMAWSRKDATVDITPLVGLTEARWLFEAWAELVMDEFATADVW